jgi:L-2-hydroxyglutarate oxidase LhgO
LDYDAIVAGGGVIGLAVARELALRGLSTLVLEAEDAPALHQSSRNSEVIHAGIYYPAGSLKSRLCLAGKSRLYAYCAERGIRAERLGKLIVATTGDEALELDRIRETAGRAGMPDLLLLTPAEAQDLEPALTCAGALLSPSTGIVDSAGYILALRGDLENAGGALVCRSRVERVALSAAGFAVTALAEGEEITLTCRMFVNAAGFSSPALAARIEGLPKTAIPEAGLAKGSYFSLSCPTPFRRLIYPVPVPGGLGTHLTLDLAGKARFGPDVEWVDRVDYAVAPARGDTFYTAIRRYWPGLPDGALVPAYAGIRAKIGPRSGQQDFRIDGPGAHGLPGLLNLFGIESPGLTSSLALAEYAADLLLEAPTV